MIIIRNTVNNTYTNSEGMKLYAALKPYFESGDKVDVSFVDLSPTSTSFLNSSIGNLIDEYGINNFKKVVRPVQITRSHADLLKKYLDSFANLV
jgi:STAS-like domain of unknown function (DUF4325)